MLEDRLELEADDFPDLVFLLLLFLLSEKDYSVFEYLDVAFEDDFLDDFTLDRFEDFGFSLIILSGISFLSDFTIG